MSKVADDADIYLLTITILPQKDGLDVVKLIRNIAAGLAVESSAIKIIYSFKISGESKIISFIQVFNLAGLERIVASLLQLGPLDVVSQPVVAYESFAKNIAIAAELCTKPSNCKLSKDGIFWLEFDIEYHGHSFDEFFAIWKNEAETVLTLRSKGEKNLELFKCLAQRRVHVLINAANHAEIDKLSFDLPIMKDNGVNIHINSKGIQYLGDYIASISG